MSTSQHYQYNQQSEPQTSSHGVSRGMATQNGFTPNGGYYGGRANRGVRTQEIVDTSMIPRSMQESQHRDLWTEI